MEQAGNSKIDRGLKGRFRNPSTTQKFATRRLKYRNSNCSSLFAK